MYRRGPNETHLTSIDRNVTNFNTLLETSPTYQEFCSSIQEQSTPIKKLRPMKTSVNVKMEWPSKMLEKNQLTINMLNEIDKDYAPKKNQVVCALLQSTNC